jgi:hypothetical protein
VARGWESKSVESQVESAQARNAGSIRDSRSAEQIERDQKRASLLLQRARVTHDIESATSERYLATLRLGLDWLDTELAKLDTAL